MKDIIYNRQKFDGNPDFNLVYRPTDSRLGNEAEIRDIRRNHDRFEGIEVMGEGTLGVLNVNGWNAIHDELDLEAEGLSPVNFYWDTMFQKEVNILCLSKRGKTGKIADLKKGGTVSFHPLPPIPEGGNMHISTRDHYSHIFLAGGRVIENAKLH